MNLRGLLEAMQRTPEQWAAPTERIKPVEAQPVRVSVIGEDRIDERYASLGDGSYRMLMSTNSDGDSYEE